MGRRGKRGTAARGGVGARSGGEGGEVVARRRQGGGRGGEVRACGAAVEDRRDPETAVRRRAIAAERISAQQGGEHRQEVRAGLRAVGGHRGIRAGHGPAGSPPPAPPAPPRPPPPPPRGASPPPPIPPLPL